MALAALRARATPGKSRGAQPDKRRTGGAGMPLFLRAHVTPKRIAGPNDAHEQEADCVAAAVDREVSEAPQQRGALDVSAPDAIRGAVETRMGADLSGVKLHTDAGSHRAAQGFGANAFTAGEDIHFNENRFDPESKEGRRLLAHELTHVAQQRTGAAPPVQFDLMMSLPTALGAFDIDMATRTAPKVGMEGHIRFLPDTTGPYSTQIGLIQVVNVTDLRTGAPDDWSTTPEADRMTLMTTGLHGAPPGWFVDTVTAATTQGSNWGPNYLEPYGESIGHNEYGWLRSPTDWHAASIYDFPGGWTYDASLEFETVAKATDTQTVYGALHWGFEIRSGAVTAEYAHAFDAQSSTFEEALERFRGFYTHEPIVLYFDTNMDTPLPGEDAKIAGVLDYLSRYPDVRLQIDGYADERGRPAHNLDLSLRRASSVESLCVALGIDPSRIDFPVGHGATTAFSAGSPAAHAGTWRANRRVVISFHRTASTPIVMP